jgi:hypothetical protein
MASKIREIMRATSAAMEIKVGNAAGPLPESPIQLS